MAFTGANFNSLLDQKTDQAYTGYNDIVKKQRVTNEAITKAIEIKVTTNDRIQVQDDLFGIFKTNSTYTPVNNTVSLIPAGSGIADYHHIMNMKAQFVSLFRNTYLSAASNTNPIQITTSKPINGRTGELMLISGVTGNTNANGLRYISREKPNTFTLFSDINLTTPIVGNGVYSGTSGQISRVIYNTAYDMKSNRKFSILDAPTMGEPYYEIADTVLKVYPLTNICSEVMVDYISTPTMIDLGDTNIDLLETYSQRFLYFICDEVGRLLGMNMRDDNLSAQEQSEMINQP